MSASVSSGSTTPDTARRHPELVTVVVPVRNGAATIASQFAALAGQCYERPWEVVVVDNGSTDRSADVARGFAGRLPGLRVVAAPELASVSHARNAGVRAAAGDFIAFCDADDAVRPGWLAAMARAAEEFDIVGGHLDVTDNRPLTVAWRGGPPAPELPVALAFKHYAVGCNFGVWRDVVEALQGWDTGYGGGCEDIDFCWRAELLSYRIGYAPEASIAYRYRDDLRSLVRQSYRSGRAEVHLHRRFRDLGPLLPTPRNYVFRVRKLIKQAPRHLRDPALRGQWIERWARLGGRAAGYLSLLRPSVRRWAQTRSP